MTRYGEENITKTVKEVFRLKIPWKDRRSDILARVMIPVSINEISAALFIGYGV